MDQTRLDAIRARCEAATPGPWVTKQPEDNFNGFSLAHLIAMTPLWRKEWDAVWAVPPGGASPSADRDFIAHARTDVPDMLDEIAALREKVAMLEDESHAEAFAWIAKERARQDQKWGYPQLNTYSEWAGILAEECGECCAELNELNFGRGDVVRLIAEAVQVAAVAVSILEHLEPAQDVTLRMAAARVAAVEIHQGGLAPAT